MTQQYNVLPGVEVQESMLSTVKAFETHQSFNFVYSEPCILSGIIWEKLELQTPDVFFLFSLNFTSQNSWSWKTRQDLRVGYRFSPSSDIIRSPGSNRLCLVVKYSAVCITSVSCTNRTTVADTRTKTGTHNRTALLIAVVPQQSLSKLIRVHKKTCAWLFDWKRREVGNVFTVSPGCLLCQSTQPEG